MTSSIKDKELRRILKGQSDEYIEGFNDALSYIKKKLIEWYNE